MREHWEEILLEMDRKLFTLATTKKVGYLHECTPTVLQFIVFNVGQKLNSGSIYNDFLRLIMFGIPSEEMTDFLTQQLGEKVKTS